MKANRINQGDIFLCVNQLFGMTYQNIAECLSENIRGMSSIDTSAVNRMANQRRKGYELLKDKADEIYECLFAGYIRGKTHDAQNDLLFNIRHWTLEENHLVFRGAEDEETYDTCEKFIRQMLKCALQNWNVCREPERHTKSSVSLQDQTFTESKIFIGRERLINEMEHILMSKRIVVLRGMAGIGKSVLARQYAVRERHSYVQRQEIISDTMSARNCSFRNMILRLSFENFKAKYDDEEESFRAKLNALLSVRNHSLLILDSVDTRPSDIELLDEIMRNSWLNVILTTRTHGVFENLPTLEVAPMRYEEQLKLFAYYTGYQLESMPDIDSVREIFRYCDGNTMYIEHIAKYIRTWECTFSEALEYMTKGGAFPNQWTAQKDHRVYEDYSFTGVFLKILFPVPVPEMRKRVLKYLALLPIEGISRRLFFDSTNREIQNELVSLENDGYVVLEHQNGRNITRLHPMIRNVVRYAFFENETECGDFIDGMCRVMLGPSTPDRTRGLYGLAMNILDFLTLKEFPDERVREWLESFRGFFKESDDSDIEMYELKNLYAAIDRIMKPVL